LGIECQDSQVIVFAIRAAIPRKSEKHAGICMSRQDRFRLIRDSDAWLGWTILSQEALDQPATAGWQKGSGCIACMWYITAVTGHGEA
jgi:hypothetical protein